MRESVASSPASVTGSETSAATGLRGVFSKARWYVSSVMGDNAYDRYVTVQQARHPGEPVMSKAEYWRCRIDAQEKDPRSRCC